jgi:hypothetical protein
MSIVSLLLNIGDERVTGMASSGITFFKNFMKIVWFKKKLKWQHTMVVLQTYWKGK